MRAVDPRLLRYAGPARPFLIRAVVAGTLSAGLVIVQAELLARGIAARSTAVLVPLAIVILARAGLAWLGEVMAQRAALSVTSRLRRTVVEHVLRLGPRWSADERSGETTALVTTGIDGVEPYVSRYLPQLALAMIVPVMMLATMASTDLVATVTIALTLPLIPLFMALVGATTSAVSRRRLDALGRLAHHFLDVVSGITTLKAFGRASAQEERVRAVGDDYRRATMRTLRLANLSTLVLDILGTIAVALVAVGVGLRLVDGRMGLRMGLFVLILTPEAYAPLRALGTHFHASAAGTAAMDRVEEILAVPVRPAGSHDETDHGVVALIVDRVSVRQPGRDECAPADASCTVAAGEFVAVVGANGAGKSTLLSVILGFTDPSSGLVRLALSGDAVAPDVGTDAWRSYFAWVPQDPYLFAGTVAENITLGSRSADLVDAAAVAALDFDLTTTIVDGGVGLSAGQRRRVAIARAVYRGAPIILLDEPTAGLDDATEHAVLQRLRGTGRTIVAVTHRPATIAIADRTVQIVRTPDPVPIMAGGTR